MRISTHKRLHTFVLNVKCHLNDCQVWRTISKTYILLLSLFPVQYAKKKVKEYSFKNHNLGHSKEKVSLSCTMCDQLFSSHASLKIHKTVQHYSTEKFNCEECGKSFGSKGYLRKHEYTHRKVDGQISCAVCQMQFKQNVDLQIHEKRKHKEESSMSHTCSVCNNLKGTIKYILWNLIGSVWNVINASSSQKSWQATWCLIVQSDRSSVRSVTNRSNGNTNWNCID